jgi:hypothetical protein
MIEGYRDQQQFAITQCAAPSCLFPANLRCKAGGDAQAFPHALTPALGIGFASTAASRYIAE